MSEKGLSCDCNTLHPELVNAVLSNMPGEDIFLPLASFYKLLGDPTRCKLIYVLLQHEMCVCDLANALSMTKSSISHQLSKMRSGGIVKCRRSGKSVYYSLDDEHVAQLFAVTMTHIQHKL